MEDLIGTSVTTAVGTTLPFYLYEAEQDTYPYATYDYTPEFVSTKDGVYKIQTDLNLRVYSDDADEALTDAESVRSAIMTAMNTSQFRTTLSSTSKECVEGIWSILYVYHIIQLS
ncbi:MAG: hypothetical protein IK076_06955 [Bacteroidales bacterium]|nr:hypothetical protein [Bacteroidales bacterium]